MLPTKPEKTLNPRLEACTMVSQLARTALIASQRIAPNGSSDFNKLLRPVGEKIWPSLLTGLKRSNFQASAPGAKLMPPCATPENAESITAASRMGTIQRSTSTELQKKSGPLLSKLPVAATYSVLR